MFARRTKYLTGRLERAFRNDSPRELRGFRFYNRELSAPAALEQEEGEAASGSNPPSPLET